MRAAVSFAMSCAALSVADFSDSLASFSFWYEASVSGFVYSSGRKEDVDTYGGTGDDRADTFALPQREEGDTEDARANTFALPRRDKTSKL